MRFLLALTVAGANVVFYDPSEALSHSEPTTATCGEMQAWAARRGAPGAFGESLPYSNVLNPPDVAVFGCDGEQDAHKLAQDFAGHNKVGVRVLNEGNYYDINEITQFQLNMWAGIVLILMLAGAIYAMATMNPEYDSLLYATFQANVASSKLD